MGSPHETNAGKEKTKIIKGLVFFIGSVIALSMGGVAVWAGSQDNSQGEYFDTLTGQWDGWHVVLHFLYPLGAVGGGVCPVWRVSAAGEEMTPSEETPARFTTRKIPASSQA